MNIEENMNLKSRSKALKRGLKTFNLVIIVENVNFISGSKNFFSLLPFWKKGLLIFWSKLQMIRPSEKAVTTLIWGYASAKKLKPPDLV
jgi:hypothetical protein